MPKHHNQGTPKDGDGSRYDDELLRANWNPVIDLLQWSIDRTKEQTRSAAPKDVSEEEAAAFLGRIYTHGS
jgi:hypothetical protein